MKKLKFIATLILGYTIGEFLTMYRLSTSDSLGAFTKVFLAKQKAVWKDITEAPSMESGLAQSKAHLFPHR